MSKNFIKVFFSLSGLIILGKTLGLVKNSLVASRYGAGFIYDMYAVEDGLINELCGIILTFISCTFIPTYVPLKKKERDEVTSIIFSMGNLFMMLLLLVGEILPGELLRILVPGYFKMYDSTLMVNITRFCLINLLGVFLTNLFATLLQANEIYIFLALEGVTSGSIMILYLLFFYKYEIWGLVVTRLIISVINVLVLVITVNKKRLFSFKLNFNYKNRYFVSMLKTAFPMLIVAVLYQVNYVVDRYMASYLNSGSVSILTYANVFSMAIYSVIGYVISSFTYPVIGKYLNDEVSFSNTSNLFLNVLCELVLPCVVFVALFSKDIVTMFYGHGIMKANDINLISRVLLIYLPGVVGYCIRNYCVKLFYLKKKTWLIVMMDFFGIALNIILNVVLVKMIGISGLALATSFVYIFTSLFLIVLSNRNGIAHIKINNTIIFKTIITVVLAAFLNVCVLNKFDGLVIRVVIMIVMFLCLFTIYNWDKMKKFVRK